MESFAEVGLWLNKDVRSTEAACACARATAAPRAANAGNAGQQFRKAEAGRL